MGQGYAIHLQAETFELLPEHALYWPSQRTLIVSDLHWGKSETFRMRGIPIPKALAEAELSRLTCVLVNTGASRLLVLGDLIHGRQGLTAHLQARIAEWRAIHNCELVVVRGNHDRFWREVSADWKITWTDAFSQGPFQFSHEPDSVSGKYVWSGHLHPTFVLQSGGDKLRLPCFHLGFDQGILPAFSHFSRGVRMSKGPNQRVFVISEERIIEV